MKKWLSILIVILLSSLPLCATAAVAVTVQIVGVEKDILKNVLTTLSLEQEKNAPNLSVGRMQRLYTAGPDEIKSAIKPFGYYHAEVTESLTQNKEGWVARYVIQLGPPVRVTGLELVLEGEGRQDEIILAAFHQFPLSKGKILNQSDYEAYKTTLQQLADDRGYFEAQFTAHEIRLNTEANKADIKLIFNTGSRYQFGQVQFKQDMFADNFLTRFLTFHPGDPYNNQKLLDLQRDLSNTSYFSVASVLPDKEHMVGKAVPVIIELKPRKRFKYTFGFGYGTDTGLRGGLGFEWRRINNYGHHLEADIKASQYINRAEARYVIPGWDPITDQYIVSSGVITEDPPERKLKSTTQHIGVSEIHSSLDGKWQRTMSLNYQIEKYENPDETRISRLLIPGVIWQITDFDDRFNPTHGYQARVDLHGAFPGSSANISQMQVSAKTVKSFGAENQILLRGDLGLTYWNQRDDVPLSLRYFAGGDNSVRGYAYQSLGPTQLDSEGNKVVIGGPFLEVVSIEYDRHLFGKWSAAVFYDAGNAMNNLSDPLKRGVGFGVRWQTPVGPVRVDLARALDLRGEPWRLHFSIGPNL